MCELIPKQTCKLNGNYVIELTEIDDQKREIDSFRPFSQELLQQVKSYFRVGIIYSSNALEGNTLTESETKVVIEDGLTVAGKPLRDHLEAQGLSNAYDKIWAMTDVSSVSEEDVLTFHRLFFQKIDDENAGSYRKIGVVISGTNYLPPKPEQISARMKQYFRSLEEQREKVHPVDFAAKAHIDLVNIHPFVDGNGRTARLVANLILLKANYGLVVIPPIRRAQYMAALVKSNSGDNHDFIQLMREQVFETQKDFIRMLRQIAP